MNNPENVNPNLNVANSLQFKSPLFCSTISVGQNHTQRFKMMSSRIYQFSQQEKLLAQKDLRIQELLQLQGKNKTTFRSQHECIGSCCNVGCETNILSNMEMQVETLRYENRNLRFLLNEKDIFIESLKDQLKHETSVLANSRKSQPNQFKFEDKMNKNNEISFDSKNISVVAQGQSYSAQIQEMYNFFNKILELYPTLLSNYNYNENLNDIPTITQKQQSPNLNLNINIKIFQSIINKLKEQGSQIQKLISQLRSLRNEYQNKNKIAANLEQTLNHKLTEIYQLLQQKTSLQGRLNNKQQQLKILYADMQRMSSQIQSMRSNQKIKQMEIFKLRHKMEQDKTYACLQIKKITQLVRKKKRNEFLCLQIEQNPDANTHNDQNSSLGSNINANQNLQDQNIQKLKLKILKHRPKKLKKIVEQESQQKQKQKQNIIQFMKKHIKQLEQTLQIQQNQIEVYQKLFKSQLQRNNRIRQMAVQFDAWFMNFSPYNHLKKTKVKKTQISTVQQKSERSQVLKIYNQSITRQNVEMSNSRQQNKSNVNQQSKSKMNMENQFQVNTQNVQNSPCIQIFQNACSNSQRFSRQNKSSKHVQQNVSKNQLIQNNKVENNQYMYASQYTQNIENLCKIQQKHSTQKIEIVSNIQIIQNIEVNSNKQEMHIETHSQQNIVQCSFNASDVRESREH